MNWIDYVIIGIISLSCIISLTRGFVRESLSLVIWVCAFFVASYYYPKVAVYLTQLNDPILRNSVAIGLLFISTLLVGALVNYTIGKLVVGTGLSGTDRVLGVCFGALRGVLIVSAILFFLDAFTPLAKSKIWQSSQLIPSFRYIISWFFDYLKNTSSLL